MEIGDYSYKSGVLLNGKLDYSYANYKRKVRTKNILTREEYTKAKQMFWKRAEDAITESIGGLSLDGIGYFGVLRSYKAKAIVVMSFNGKRTVYNTHSKGYSFTINRFNVRRKEAATDWLFVPLGKTKKKLYDRLYRQYGYEFRLSTVRNIYTTAKHKPQVWKQK